MAPVIGVALEAAVVRAAYRDGAHTKMVERAWDPQAPERAVDVLRSVIGSAGSIVLSIGLGFLEVAKPALPVMAGSDRRRVLLRDADRYFPLDGVLAVSAGAESSLAYATTSDQLQRWLRAFEEWAPVIGVVSAPDAIAAIAITSGSFLVDAGNGEHGLLQLLNGHVREARRLAESASDSATKDATSLLMSGTEGAPGKFSAALGALAFVNAPLESMLLDAPLEQLLRSTRARRRWMSYAFAVVALFAVGAAASSRRDATLRATQHAVDSLRTSAAPGLAAQALLNQLTEEDRILASRIGPATDPLHVLATISEALPRDAFVQRLEWDGKEWRLEGSVNQAAAIVPQLDSTRAFTNVRVSGASTRFRDGTRMRESFSVAFQVKGDSVAGR